ncbi:MAG: bifunctional 5,10-methylenetetrahydrofolate dehydrogenase/5,10-methenyltetrahydrofolate cyclohydrolase, partial [Candidatus Sumerlaeota bacterium]|nr:bifunctional 5,10-methylenetetrahydrofolate dehydrogenase/5,10-methenyltetrahydrofolate cyclohydrolase [Candidatus Sumerlaeota bacterium]
MAAQIIDGKSIAADIQREVAEEGARLVKEKGVKPGLAVILVGDDPASKVYVNMKARTCVELGFHSESIALPADSTQERVASEIRRLNDDPSIHGVLLQIPVPDQLDADALILAISPDKDIDGLHPLNAGRLAMGLPGFVPCTPAGVIQLLLRSGVDPRGKKAVIVGRSNLVGRPLAQLLSLKRRGGDATVTICHSR